jgi:hypothetical protein
MALLHGCLVDVLLTRSTGKLGPLGTAISPVHCTDNQRKWKKDAGMRRRKQGMMQMMREGGLPGASCRKRREPSTAAPCKPPTTTASRRTQRRSAAVAPPLAAAPTPAIPTPPSPTSHSSPKPYLLAHDPTKPYHSTRHSTPCQSSSSTRSQSHPTQNRATATGNHSHHQQV